MDFPENKYRKIEYLIKNIKIIITIILAIVDVSELILSIGWSNLSEYIIGANNTGATSNGKSRRKLNNKIFLTSLLMPKTNKIYDFFFL